MKTRNFERNRKLQKQYGSKPNQKFDEGIIVRHVYSDRDSSDTRSWWDDTGFNLNGVRVSIWWIHPRMAYTDAISEIAHTNVPIDYEDTDLFSSSTKLYKKVGKSGKRKKICAYQMKNTNDAQRHAWYERLTAEEERLKAESSTTVTPYMKVEALDWCRGVSLCVPIEVHGIPDLHKLCELVKKVLKGDTTIAKEFPGYKYTKDDWIAEELKFKN